MQKNRTFSGLGQDRKAPRATSRPVDHWPTWYFRGRHLHSLALPDTKRVGYGLILCRDRRSIVTWAVFDQCVDNFQRKSTGSTACSRMNKKKTNIFSPFFPQWRWKLTFGRIIFWMVRNEKNAASHFHCHRSQVFEYLRETFLQIFLVYLKSARLKKHENKVVLGRKRLAIIDRFEGLWSVGTRFGH